MIGVDLIEFKKAQVFYKFHKERLSSFFTKREIAFIQKGRRPYVNLAVLLAAKEAVFKSLGGPEGGVASFLDIHVIPARNRRFSFMVKKDYVVAQCAGI